MCDPIAAVELLYGFLILTFGPLAPYILGFIICAVIAVIYVDNSVKRQANEPNTDSHTHSN